MDVSSERVPEGDSEGQDPGGSQRADPPFEFCVRLPMTSDIVVTDLLGVKGGS
jgi:hypothetical protein